MIISSRWDCTEGAGKTAINLIALSSLNLNFELLDNIAPMLGFGGLESS